MDLKHSKLYTMGLGSRHSKLYAIGQKPTIAKSIKFSIWLKLPYLKPEFAKILTVGAQVYYYLLIQLIKVPFI
jgi:hypothetical protein